MHLHTQTALVVCALALALPKTGFGEETNDLSSLFGITVTNKTSEAEQLFESGSAYYTGDGAEKNAAKAMEYFKKAADLGFAEAQYNLGVCCMTGEGIEQNEEDAAKWLQKASEQGVEKAIYPLGLCYYNLEQYTEAYAWALVAESNGDTRLKNMLETMFTEDEIAAGKKRFEEMKAATEEKPAKPE